MKCLIILISLLVVFVHLILAKDLVIGTRINNLLVSTEKVVVQSLPFIRRDKDYNYVDPKNRIIKVINANYPTNPAFYQSLPAFYQSLPAFYCMHEGIIARDLSRTEAEAEVTSGGVGANNVTLHLKSERGKGLNYLILIFSNNN